MSRFLILAAALLLPSCGPRFHQPRGTLGGLDARDAGLSEEQGKYVATARAYVAAAQAGDQHKLMALTSPLTIKNTGRAHLEKVQRTEIIPAFAGTHVKWGKVEKGSDDTGNRFMAVSAEVSGKQAYHLVVSVAKEDGKFRVFAINRFAKE